MRRVLFLALYFAALVIGTADASRVPLTGAGVPKLIPSVVFVNSYVTDVDCGNPTPCTIAVDLGAVTANRCIIVGAGAINSAGGTTLTISSSTIAGVTATTQQLVNDGTASTGMAAIISALVPTGTSGNVVINLSASAARIGIGVWAGYSLSSCNKVLGVSSTADPAALSINTVQGDVIVGMVFTNTGTTTTWAGLTEDFDRTIEGAMVSGASAVAATTETPRTITSDYAAPDATRRDGVAITVR
jgi:hypothetical protein